MKWEPKDVISAVIIAGSMAMICLGIDGAVKGILLAAVIAYYGLDLTPFIRLGRNQKRKKEE